MKTINREELEKLLKSGEKFTLLDVIPAEYYQRAHLPGAKNCCVYEMTFLEKVALEVPNKEELLIVYGSGIHSRDSCTAQEKLERNGYQQVRVYRGGIEEWQGGEKREVGLPNRPREGRHEIDTIKSQLLWTGRNINGSHRGGISLRSGWIEMNSGLVTHGEFQLEMDSITDMDLTESALNQMLIAHLKSDDFFDVALYPTAIFHLRQVVFDPQVQAGSINAQIKGALTLKGVTEELDFPALLEVLPGGSLSAEAHFDIDRTRWNVIYGSGKFYEKLGQHLVHDLISLNLHLVTR